MPRPGGIQRQKSIHRPTPKTPKAVPHSTLRTSEATTAPVYEHPARAILRSSPSQPRRLQPEKATIVRHAQRRKRRNGNPLFGNHDRTNATPRREIWYCAMLKSGLRYYAIPQMGFAEMPLANYVTLLECLFAIFFPFDVFLHLI